MVDGVAEKAAKVVVEAEAGGKHSKHLGGPFNVFVYLL